MSCFLCERGIVDSAGVCTLLLALTDWEDILVIALYFACVLAVGLWSLCRPNRESVKGYFLAGRDMMWLPVGASLYASNIGSEHFVGLAGTGAAAGIAVVLYEFASMPLVMLLGWFFLPVYITAGVYTLPEYMEKRFGGPLLRIYLSCLALVLYVVTKIAVSMYAGALFINIATGWDMYVSVTILLVITCIYTILGGLAAVMYTDTLQTVIMSIGALILTVIGFIEIGGYTELEYVYFQAVPEIRNANTSCGIPRDDAFHILRDPVTSDNPWPGLILQSSVGCLWYWCADQVIVQRALAAKNISHAKGGSILAGYLKLLPLFFMVFPGMISRALYPDEVGCADAEECDRICGNSVGCSNLAYPSLVMNLLPKGLRGLLMAVMLSAIMSSLTSIFNSASTLFTMDLWRRLRRSATDRELLLVGRICIVFLCGVSIAWIPLVQSSAGGQLFVYIQAIQGYLGTPVGAIFLLAVFWTRTTEKGAFLGILLGHTCGVIRMVLDFVYPEPQCGELDTRPAIVADVHYTYFGQLVFLITLVTVIVVSLLTKPKEDVKLDGVTWWTRLDIGKNISRHTETAKMVETTDAEQQQQKSVTENGVGGEDDAEIRSASCYQRLCHFLCGSSSQQKDTKEEDSPEQILQLLSQSKTSRSLLNFNAVLALCVSVFLLGFYH